MTGTGRPTRWISCGGLVEVGVGHRRQLGRAELGVVEARGLGRLEVLSGVHQPTWTADGCQAWTMKGAAKTSHREARAGGESS